MNHHGQWLVRGDTPEYKAYLREATGLGEALTDDDERFRDTDPFVTCSYCGSLHPDEFLRAIRLGAEVGGSDWKYGWPHKFYVDWPNPTPEQLYPISRLSPGTPPEDVGLRPGAYDWREEDGRWVGYGKRATLHTKFYAEHLKGWEGLTPEVVKLIEDATGIRFEHRGDGYLAYSSPSYGYQR